MTEEDDRGDKFEYLKLAEVIKNALRNVWQEAAHDVFDIGSVVLPIKISHHKPSFNVTMI